MIEVKALLKKGIMIEAYNSWNKKFNVPVKGVGTIPDSFQLVPDARALIPTGITLNVPAGHLVKLFAARDAVLLKGLTIAGGVQIVKPGEEGQLYLIVRNVTDSLVVISNGDILAEGFLEKTIDKDVVVV